MHVFIAANHLSVANFVACELDMLGDLASSGRRFYVCL